ncbi:unnamed protein product [Zymoseptoria tritici ST99CH_1A5]|uniref:Uncharacterized protein n=1 Tax=Zymoseptoria tritici ST99CH_1A5 TaxID=1276529 RepID=A0A1Y6LIE6_ZYMTR|nr:unnamed protein product [Zymoseptoria tritici ST99CH_1A5]
MVASYEGQIPSELRDKWANYLPPSRAALFRKTCAEASLQTLGIDLRPFFATWKTSLMHSSLETLKSISNDDDIRSLVEILVIEDDTSQLDPYSSSELPSSHKSYDIWPLSSAGLIVTSGGDIAISDLITMLREKKFPGLYSLKIRDYAISPINFRLCDEMLCAKNLLIPRNTWGPTAVSSFARDILESAGAAETDLLLTSLEIEHANLPLAEDSVFHSSRFRDSTETSLLSRPVIYETVMGFSSSSSHDGSQPLTTGPLEEQQQQKSTQQFSILRSAKLLLTGGDDATTIYWLERVFSSSSLRTLELSFTSPLSLATRGEKFKTARLAEFILRDTTTSAQDILAMLSSSKTSLVELTFRQVTLLDDGSTWASLLSLIAKDFQALTSFHLRVLREKARGSLAIDYSNRLETDQLDEFRGGLSVTEKGTGINRRVTNVGYRGVEAGFVLDCLAEDLRS